MVQQPMSTLLGAMGGCLVALDGKGGWQVSGQTPCPAARRVRRLKALLGGCPGVLADRAFFQEAGPGMVYSRDFADARAVRTSAKDLPPAVQAISLGRPSVLHLPLGGRAGAEPPARSQGGPSEKKGTAPWFESLQHTPALQAIQGFLCDSRKTCFKCVP